MRKKTEAKLPTQKIVQGILKKVASGTLSANEGYARLQFLSSQTIQQMKMDHHRLLRKGVPEIVFSEGKTLKQLRELITAFLAQKAPVILSRLSSKKYASLRDEFPKLQYDEKANIAWLAFKSAQKNIKKSKPIAIVTAGASDEPIAEEAARVCELLGQPVKRFYDCGVAGLHRLLDQLPEIAKCRLTIAIAGMEGTMPGVLAGLLPIPVVAVPTSVGYGTGLKGVSAMMTMLNSCAPGLVVVNIDNGLGAALFAVMVRK